MKRQSPDYFDIPQDLWAEFEATKGSLPKLRLAVEKTLENPQILVKTIEILIKTDHDRGKTMITKGVRWPEPLWQSIKILSNRLHTTQSGLIRLIIESYIAGNTHAK